MRGLTSPVVPGFPLVRPPSGLEQLRVRVLVLGFWILLGLMETTKEWITARMEGAPRPLSDAILVNFPWWFFWVFGTLVVVGVARRRPLDGGHRIRAFALHTLVALAFAVLHLTLVATLIYFSVSRGTQSAGAIFATQLRFWLQGYVVLDFFVYWMVLGAYHALLYHRRYAEGRAREAEARLHALQMELQPHFLYNSLNAVAALVEHGQGREATTVLARLGELLRRTLRRGYEHEVELEDELDYVEQYLAIEQVRFGGRLRVRITAGANVRRAAVPPMILQPLVENSVRHGAATVPGPTSIEIHAHQEGEALRLSVWDEGPGPPTGEGRGTGLRNVASRLEALYGPRGILSVDPVNGGGCLAEIQLPFRNAPRNRAAGAGGRG